MSSRLDQALDEVIQDRRSDRSSGGGKRSNNFRGNNGGRTDFTRRRQVDSDGTIRKRLGPSEGIRSFVRTVDVKNDSRGRGGVNSLWAHDKFDEDEDRVYSNSSSIISRLGGRGGNTTGPKFNRTSDISIENLHYNVTEQDVKELFATVGDVVGAKLIFDASGRSTGVATVKYSHLEDAEKAIAKYNTIELDGQAMRIQMKEYAPRQSKPRGRSDGSRYDRSSRINRGHRDERGNRTRDDRRPSDNSQRNSRSKQALSAEDLDREMDSYMKSNVANEDTDMMD